MREINFDSNFYEELGIKNFSLLEEIKKSFRKKAFFLHPDRGGDIDKMKRLNFIYNTLIKNKPVYDAWLERKLNPYKSEIIISFHAGGSDNSTSSTIFYSW